MNSVEPRRRIHLAVAFLGGAGLAAAVTAFVLLSWHQSQSRLFWTTVLHEQATLAMQLRRGDVDKALSRLDRRLPSMVESVKSFGDQEETLPALRRAYEYAELKSDPMSRPSKPGE